MNFLKIIFSVVVSLAFYTASGQTFSGKLTYKFSTNDSIFYKDSFLVKLAEEYGNPNNAITGVLVKGNRFFSECKSKEHKLLFKLYQNRDTAFLVGGNQKDKSKYSKNMTATLKPLSKSEDYKYILGFKCKKYLYADINSEQIFTVWIPDNFGFNKQAKNGKFFSLYFFPDGLAFNIEVAYKGTVSKHELIILELYDVPDGDFNIEN